MCNFYQFSVKLIKNLIFWHKAKRRQPNNLQQPQPGSRSPKCLANNLIID